MHRLFQLFLCFFFCFRSDNFSFSDYGTVLFINSVEYTPDGRSLITTTGERRFKVVGRSMRDGYNCAKIKFVFDEQINDPAQIGKCKCRGVCVCMCVCVCVCACVCVCLELKEKGGEMGLVR